MPEDIPQSIPQQQGEGFQIGRRFWLAIKGSFWRTLLRLLAGIASLFLLGIYAVQCKLNYIGSNLATMNWIDYFQAMFSAFWFGFKRSATMLYYYLTSFGSLDLATRWGDGFIVFVTFAIFFFACYSMVAIFCDALDGSPEDKSSMLIKIPITLAVTIIVSGFIFIASEKPSDQYELNTNLFLDKYGSDQCAETGKVPLFIPIDSHAYAFNSTEQTDPEINDSSIIII